MAEAILSSVAEGVQLKLGSLVIQETRQLAGARDELEKMSQSLSTVRSLLPEAESWRTHHDDDLSQKAWLTQLKAAIYDADDLLDDLSVMAAGKVFCKEVRLFFSGLRMVPRIGDLSARLERLVEDGGKLLLKQLPSPPNPTRPANVSVSVSPSHVSVVGRVADKEAVIEALLHRHCEEDVGIVGIVGVGGIGKTTLARMVFDDLILKTEFQYRLWVSVGGDFDVERILQDMMIQLSRQFLGMDSSPGTLSLSNKKVLLVLDDMQHDDPEKWSKLRYLLEQAARGSRVLLTSRVATQPPVLLMMGVHHLGGLSEAESWSLFQQVASQREHDEEHCNRERVGREIINKCAGVPLAIKMVVSVLRFRSIQDWTHFATQELPNSDGGETAMSALNLSYKHLPPHLKPCFLCCSLYPKGQKIHVPRLINLWIAQGYVKPSHPSQCLEAAGVQHFMELLRMSFFEEVEEDELGNIVSCRMHDLTRDLATIVNREEFVFFSKGWRLIKPKSRHATFSVDPTTPWAVPDHLFEASNLRALLLSNETRSHPVVLKSVLKQGCQLEEKQLHLIASKLALLRALDLHNSNITIVPTSIGNLKFLTYLDLSENKKIEVLPDSICRLLLLQILNLDNCERLWKLPRDTKDLANLIHLGLENCRNLTQMPRGIGRLTSLSTLSRFMLPIHSSFAKHSASLGELHNLNGLRGTLRIYNLSHAEGA